jgi:hypothetical protein
VLESAKTQAAGYEDYSLLSQCRREHGFHAERQEIGLRRVEILAQRASD